ncbi:hypothetical protein MtrunA17_Chr1g0203291 [Medicago truncatula]|uniref:Transmembrane protein n=1 Tax=Medicago truncatula TaxID=3880 RepID=A0A396JWY9_MEDTR|nr:hypothetical protein MtrunA17_Chr1g0203291 [Medicago truncatula]
MCHFHSFTFVISFSATSLHTQSTFLPPSEFLSLSPSLFSLHYRSSFLFLFFFFFCGHLYSGNHISQVKFTGSDENNDTGKPDGGDGDADGEEEHEFN